MPQQTIRNIALEGRRVLMRVDFNVPLDGTRITDDTRIRASVPTIQYALQHNARVILMSHLGRPDGRIVESLRLEPVAARLSDFLGRPVQALRECVGAEVQTAVQQMRPGQVMLLENLRFHPEEEANDPAFAKQLAALGEVYVNDAFGAAHRAHASTEGVALHLPAVAGLLLEKEFH
ncbi:MAG: phosphoglycerate kinase [Candidatus Omnitrophica bacterium]|nr:phosphoglycerate kinase [Candidatus Omnitrophota bacterium]